MQNQTAISITSKVIRPPATRRLVRTEYTLLFITIISRLIHLYLQSGKVSGWDSNSFINTVNAYKLPGEFPDLERFMAGYHPPASFMLVKSVVTMSGLPPVLASQLVSFVSMLCVFFLLRQILKKIGLLHTLFGLIFLYISASLPVLLRLSVASTYDSLVCLLGVIVLYLSIDLFWEPSLFSIKKSSCRQKLILLFGTLVLGLMTKYNCLLFFSFPFVVLFVRCHLTLIPRHAAIISIVCLLAIATVTPFYHQRYYVKTGEWMPMGMDWNISTKLDMLRKERDKNRTAFVLSAMRIPFEHFLPEMPIKDSLPYEVWFETWKPPRIYKKGVFRFMPNVYVHLFIPIFLLGLLSFLTHYRKRGNALSDFGWILTGCSIVSVIGLLYFGYKYPYFPWRVFKAKYVPLTILWIGFLCALGITVMAKLPKNRTLATLASSTALFLVTIMIVINHTISR